MTQFFAGVARGRSSGSIMELSFRPPWPSAYLGCGGGGCDDVAVLDSWIRSSDPVTRSRHRYHPEGAGGNTCASRASREAFGKETLAGFIPAFVSFSIFANQRNLAVALALRLVC